MSRKALLSVHDKTGIAEFAAGLSGLGWDLISSGGTAAVLKGSGVKVTEVSDHTGSPAMLGHRVVTLHPKIHGGILADRNDRGHGMEMARYGIEPIDLVAVNLYPFASKPGLDMIDIGGSALIRAAAKNHPSVGVVVNPRDYGRILDELDSYGDLSDATRLRLARTAFAHTAAYDSVVADWFDSLDEGSSPLPSTLRMTLERAETLRYGENPHQSAARYRLAGPCSGNDNSAWWDRTSLLGGPPPSYLNVLDAGAAWALVHDLGDGPAVAVIKHAAPCGAALGRSLREAYRKAIDCDPRAAFGGVAAFNRVVDEAAISVFEEAPQADVVIAPGYDDGVIERIRARRSATRILRAPRPEVPVRTVRQIEGGWLVQSATGSGPGIGGWKVVSRRPPTPSEEADASVAWTICRYVLSNAVVMARDGMAVGIGGGQQDRVGAVELAAARAGGRSSGGACASDGFFPFADGIEVAAEAGITVIVQPGGSINDEKVISAADARGMAMVFTGERRFRH